MELVSLINARFQSLQLNKDRTLRLPNTVGHFVNFYTLKVNEVFYLLKCLTKRIFDKRTQHQIRWSMQWQNTMIETKVWKLTKTFFNIVFIFFFFDSFTKSEEQDWRRSLVSESKCSTETNKLKHYTISFKRWDNMTSLLIDPNSLY